MHTVRRYICLLVVTSWTIKWFSLLYLSLKQEKESNNSQALSSSMVFFYIKKYPPSDKKSMQVILVLCNTLSQLYYAHEKINCYNVNIWKHSACGLTVVTVYAQTSSTRSVHIIQSLALHLELFLHSAFLPTRHALHFYILC